MPSLGTPQRTVSPAAVIGVSLALGLGAGIVYWLKQGDPPPVDREELRAPPPSAGPDASEAAAPAPSVSAIPGLRRVSLKIDGALETALVREVGGDLGRALAQVANRALVWWVQVPHDLRRGDTLELLFTERAGDEPLIHAIRFHSGKTAQTFEAYRFHAPGEEFARFYTPDGAELELRLNNSPLDRYDQITSLIRDGRGHKGVDFRAPVGTPIKAPFDAVVTRKNWNWRANGNCLELKEVGGNRTVLMLHLDVFPKPIEVGQRVRRGEVIAQSGNTGRSFAPHLHYQLMGPGNRVLDPFEAQGSHRQRLDGSARTALQNEIARLQALLDAER